MRRLPCIAPFALVTLVTLVACVDHPPSFEAPPSVRIVLSWDPRACGAPHRVAIELEDEAGVPLSSSAPCALGGLTVEAPHFGVYLGRLYAWEAERPIRSITPLRLYVDEPISRW